MVIGDFVGYSSLGSAYTRGVSTPARPAVTLEAKRDPESSHEYSVQLLPAVAESGEEQARLEEFMKKSQQNRDPVSQAFMGVADYKPAKYKIDVFV